MRSVRRGTEAGADGRQSAPLSTGKGLCSYHCPHPQLQTEGQAPSLALHITVQTAL